MSIAGAAQGPAVAELRQARTLRCASSVHREPQRVYSAYIPAANRPQDSPKAEYLSQIYMVAPICRRSANRRECGAKCREPAGMAGAVLAGFRGCWGLGPQRDPADVGERDRKRTAEAAADMCVTSPRALWVAALGSVLEWSIALPRSLSAKRSLFDGGLVVKWGLCWVW
jgi:hypothetical protein